MTTVERAGAAGERRCLERREPDGGVKVWVCVSERGRGATNCLCRDIIFSAHCVCVTAARGVVRPYLRRA